MSDQTKPKPKPKLRWNRPMNEVAKWLRKRAHKPGVTPSRRAELNRAAQNADVLHKIKTQIQQSPTSNQEIGETIGAEEAGAPRDAGKMQSASERKDPGASLRPGEVAGGFHVV